jgi:deoxyribodipyrimidine photo-lyase
MTDAAGTAVVWFRRDLRLADHPALVAAADAADRVVGDLASNQHGWQWAAGTGTDAAPYFRAFNPVAQSKRFDPDGAYLRRWLPELADLDQSVIHEPWKLAGGPPNGYPARIVDHAEERAEALRRYDEIR